MRTRQLAMRLGMTRTQLEIIMRAKYVYKDTQGNLHPHDKYRHLFSPEMGTEIVFSPLGARHFMRHLDTSNIADSWIRNVLEEVGQKIPYPCP